MTLTLAEIDRILDTALAEDGSRGDITSALVVPAEATLKLLCVTREACIVCGLPLMERLYQRLGAGLRYLPHVREGNAVEAGARLFTVDGPARTLLGAERVALNLLQHLSGIATTTRRYVGAVQGTHAAILDTRKTLPGLRAIQKYAVQVGGGVNHRMGLNDGILIKDNHIDLAGGVGQAVRTAQEKLRARGQNMPIEVECDTLPQVEEALAACADILLLDNMTLPDLRRAVTIASGKALTEASGGVTLETIWAIAETGVDRISIGALTHSVQSIDIGMDIV